MTEGDDSSQPTEEKRQKPLTWLGPQLNLCWQSYACNCPQEWVTEKSLDQDADRVF